MKRTNVGSLDHRHVVPSVPDAAHSLLRMLPDQSRHVGLLRRGTSTRNDGRKLGRKFDKVVPEVLDEELERLAINHETAVNLCL